MSKRAIRTAQDFRDFFRAFSRQDWEATVSYLHDDCVWDASERRMQGIGAIMDYWQKDHSSIRETLGSPENIVFGKGMAYLQVLIKLKFIADGTYMGKPYAKGRVVEVPCVDVYTFAQDNTIKECRVYTKFRQG
ncbi:nuclear transport factor 2 family protein [Dethiosulfatarculus sandiegensis]|uniref:SnoaL-like domain-containing protein n=1 Tax=Dethiosulfatarculus sandiegensis TaxID=1429043 RepID=A0A0D2HMD1_9BACT|nr:nuclear transport factor 2 family protein [Dethiosulfatarculus sandiegensis]KIX11768.1 hypothetical protein X474_22835 [Dethiosulfatarculus sandiegensis]